MTIKKRLILSHILVFVVPILMTAILFLMAAGGLWLFTQSGNHVYVESSTQFNRASDVVHHFVFRALRSSGDDPEHYKWIIEMLSPEQSYVVLEKDGGRIYEYGNGQLAGMMEDIPSDIRERPFFSQKRDTYVHADTGQFYYMEKQYINDSLYHLYFVSRQMPHGTDDAVEHATQGTLFAIFLAFFLLLAGTIFFLTRFVLRYILQALRLLQNGSDQVRQGNLTCRLTYNHMDEVAPVVDTFNIMTEELERSLQERTRQEENRKELIASMSHDIRTPLTAIRAYIEGLADNVANTPERRRHYIEVIQKKTEDMSRMIDQLFLFSKMDLGEKALPLQSLELNEVISDIIEENKEGWQCHQALVVWQRSPEKLPVIGSREVWQRIMTNLVANSIKYKTEEDVHIRIRAWRQDNTVCLEVVDDGPGVPEEALTRLAEPFYRTDKARSRTGDGSGLGLSIVARGMQLMGGTVIFLPVHSHGLCVHMELPAGGDAL